MPRREKEGIVVSDKMNKSRVVVIHEKKSHPKYHKFQDRTIRFMAHDEANETHVGDKVKIVESRPLSAKKRWVITEVIEKAVQV